MQRIDVTSASPTLAAPAALGTPGYFTDGDPIAATAATIVDADWLNMIQEELMAIVAAGGLAPSKTNLAQVLAALQVIFPSTTSFAGLIAPSGYQKLPGGLIIQWAFNTLLPNQTLSTVTFPIAFPNTALIMVASAGQLLTLNANQVGVGAAPASRTQGQIAVAATVSGSTGVYYIAIGN